LLPGSTRGSSPLRFAVARHVDLRRIVLCGGCFQNQLLTGSLTRALEAAGHIAYLPGQIPGNDAGISAGQAAVAALGL
jgi:hydrogenase maturation protein HypF